MSLLPRRLGARLNFFLFVLLAGLGIATALVVLGGFRQSEENANRASREGIEEFGADNVGVLARLASDSASANLVPLEQVTRTAAAFLLDAFELTTISTDESLATVPSGGFYNPDPDRLSDIWAPPTSLDDPAVERDREMSVVLDALLPRALQQHPEAEAAYFVAASGLIRHYPIVDLHERMDTLDTAEDEPVILLAGPEQNPDRETIWTTPYQNPAGGLRVSVATPVYDGDTFLGVVGIDVALESFVANIDLLRPSPNGYAFLIDDDGDIVPGRSEPVIQEALQDPANVAIGRVVAAMRAGHAGTQRLSIADEEVVVGYAPLGATGGSLGLVTPIDDITEQAGVVAVTDAISRDAQQTVMVIGITALILFALALGVAAYMNRRFLVRPIDQLVAGTQAVAAGDLDTAIPIARRDELGELASAFNEMTGRLAARESDLLTETAERQRAEQELQALFAAMSDVVLVLDRDGTYQRISPARPDLLYLPADQLLGRNVSELLPPEQATAFINAIQSALDEGATQTIEYQLPEMDRWFLGAVSPMPDGRVVWVARDITERVQARHLLEQAVDERTRELSTLIDVSHSTASNIELSPLLAMLLGQLHQVVEFDGAAVMGLVEDDELVVMDSRAFGQREDEIIGRRIDVQRLGDVWERIQAGNPVIVSDLRGDSLEARAFREALGPDILPIVLRYAESWMAVPMQTREHTVGMLSVSRHEPGYFDEHHAELASAFANFAAIGIDNARLFAGAQRHVRQNTALARVTTNLQSIELLDESLDALAADVVEACGITACSIILTKPEAPFFGRAGQYGLSPDYLPKMHASWERGSMLVGPEDLSFARPTVARNARLSMLNDEGFALLHPVLREAAFDDVIVAPIAVNGEIGGVVCFYIPIGESASVEDIAFCHAVAAQASIVISNATLFRESESRAHDLEVILTAADRLSSTLEMEPLIQIALDQVSVIAPHDDEGVCLVEGDGVRLYQRRDGEHEKPFLAQEIDSGATDPLLTRVLEGEVILVRDGFDDDKVTASGLNGASALAVGDGARSFLCVPLVVSGRVIGALSLSSHERNAFDNRHLRLAQAVAYQMAVAFENARLYSQTLKRERENRALASVASALTLDQPVGSTLDAISRGVVETTDAIACSVILQDENGDFVMGGAHGLPPGFSNLMAESVMNGAPSAAMAVFLSGVPRLLPGARALALDEPLYKPAHHVLHGAEWEHSAIFPLIYRGRTIGNLATYYPENILPDADAMTLLDAIAGQAAFAVENARLFAETVRRERENRALAGVSSALALDQPVEATFNAIAERVVETTRAVACAVTLLDDRGEYVLGGEAHLPQGFAEAMIRAIASGAPSAVYDVMKSGESQVHVGLREYFRKRAGFEPVAPLVENVEWDNVAVVPLAYRSRVIGSLSTFYLPDFVPGEDELGLLVDVAGQAAFAVENARLFAETEERALEMEALFRADEELYRSLEMAHVFQSLVDVAVDVLGCDTSVLIRWEARTNDLTLAAHRGFNPDTIAAAGDLSVSGSLEEAIRSRDVVCVEDAAQETGPNRQLSLREGIESYIHVPITIDGQVFGIYNIGYRRPHTFTREERRFWMALSQRAVVAIQNARLYEQAQQAASLEERQRIARDLHDSVSQALYGIGLGARTAKSLLASDPKQLEQPLDYILSLSDAGLAELRALIFELRPDSLTTDGLVAALERQIAATRARHQLEVESELIDEPDVSIEAKETIYRVAQEALTNAIKHARASRLTVCLAWEGSMLELTVLDDGVGFEPDSDFPGHMGLQSMHERAHRLGGTLSITSSPGSGTLVRIALPASE